MIQSRFWFLTALTVVAAASRIAPHPLNFAPMTAVALFGAATFSKRWMGVAVAFGSLLLSDLLLQLTYQEGGWQPNPGFYRGQWVVYACMLPTLLIGFAIRGRRNVATVAAATLASSVFFFIATNFAVWASPGGTLYPKTAQGLLLCYEAAIPFFKNSLAGDTCYATLLFGGLALADAIFPALRKAEPAPALSAQ